MKKFIKRFILVATVATIVATSFVFADIPQVFYLDLGHVPVEQDLPATNGAAVVPIIPGDRNFVRNDWVYIAERNNYMHTTLYDNGTIEATRDKSFASSFNGLQGYYGTDQEGFMLKGYVFYEDNLYYFQPGGKEVGRLLSNTTIEYMGKSHVIDEYGRIQGDLTDFFKNAHIYTMGLYKENT